MMVMCPKCGYEWETRAKGEMITCPSCHRKFARPDPVVVDLARMVPITAHCSWCGIKYVCLDICTVDGDPAFLCHHCNPHRPKLH